jgi:hypothetical protein
MDLYKELIILIHWEINDGQAVYVCDTLLMRLLLAV